MSFLLINHPLIRYLNVSYHFHEFHFMNYLFIYCLWICDPLQNYLQINSNPFDYPYYFDYLLIKLIYFDEPIVEDLLLSYFTISYPLYYPQYDDPFIKNLSIYLDVCLHYDHLIGFHLTQELLLLQFHQLIFYYHAYFYLIFSFDHLLHVVNHLNLLSIFIKPPNSIITNFLVIQLLISSFILQLHAFF